MTTTRTQIQLRYHPLDIMFSIRYEYLRGANWFMFVIEENQNLIVAARKNAEVLGYMRDWCVTGDSGALSNRLSAYTARTFTPEKYYYEIKPKNSVHPVTNATQIDNVLTYKRFGYDYELVYNRFLDEIMFTIRKGNFVQYIHLNCMGSDVMNDGLRYFDVKPYPISDTLDAFN